MRSWDCNECWPMKSFNFIFAHSALVTAVLEYIIDVHSSDGQHTRMHNTHACMHAQHTCAHTHTYVRTYVRMHACARAHTHTHTHTHTTDTCTHNTLDNIGSSEIGNLSTFISVDSSQDTSDLVNFVLIVLWGLKFDTF